MQSSLVWIDSCLVLRRRSEGGRRIRLLSASRRLTRRVAEPARGWVAMRRGCVHAGQRGMVLTLLGHPPSLSGPRSSILHFSLAGGRHAICAHSRMRGLGHAGKRYGRVFKKQSNEDLEEHEREQLRWHDSVFGKERCSMFTFCSFLQRLIHLKLGPKPQLPRVASKLKNLVRGKVARR